MIHKLAITNFVRLIPGRFNSKLLDTVAITKNSIERNSVLINIQLVGCLPRGTAFAAPKIQTKKNTLNKTQNPFSARIVASSLLAEKKTTI